VWELGVVEHQLDRRERRIVEDVDDQDRCCHRDPGF
jgi:hypothetical protein